MEVDGINSSLSKTDSFIITFHRVYKKIYNYLKDNKIIVGCVIAIILIVAITYLYSFRYRSNQKTAYLLNTFKYTTP